MASLVFARTLNQEGRASVGATVVLFTVGARRQIEGPGEDAGKGLLRIEAILQADIRPADRCHADRGRPAAASFREYSAPGSPFIL